MESKDNDIQYVSYSSELQMPDIMKLIQKDLSEPYSIYTYRYFIHNWPKLCFLVRILSKFSSFILFSFLLSGRYRYIRCLLCALFYANDIGPLYFCYRETLTIISGRFCMTAEKNPTSFSIPSAPSDAKFIKKRVLSVRQGNAR